MKHYLFILAQKNGDINLVGTTTNIVKAVATFKAMPAIEKDKMNKLVYLEEYSSAEATTGRFNEVTRFTKQQKLELIQKVNPDMVELLPGVNIEL